MGMLSYPVNLVEIIRLKHDTADDAGTGGCLQGDRYFAEEDVEVALDGGSIAFLADGKLGAVGACLDGAGSSGPLV